MNFRETLKPILLVLVVIAVLRLPAFWTPILDVDEAQFAGFADWLIAGGKPYLSSLDTKPLGIYWFYAAIFRIFGRNNMIAVHAVTALWVWATAIFCYLTAKELFSKHAGLWAALLYAIFTTTYVPKFISTSIVVVMMLPLTASIYCAVLWERRRALGFMWLAGVLWAVACLFKYQAGINLIVMAIYLLVVRPLIAKSAREIRIREFLSFVFGGAIVATAYVLYLKSAGVWDDFYYWSIHGSMAYIGAGAELGHFWMKLAVRGGAFVASSFLVWFLAAWQSARILGNLDTPGGRERRAQHLVLVWLILSFVPVVTGGKFYGHYFIQLLPALCILASGPVAGFLERFNWTTSGMGRKAACILLILGIVVPSTGFFAARLAADRIYAAIGEENPRQYIPIADYIRKNSNEDDTIFVWGFATPIYFFSNRLGASRFLWCDWLTGRAPGTDAAKDPDFDSSVFITPGSWRLFFEDMRRNRPVYFVDTSPGDHHDYGKYPIDRYPGLKQFIEDNYQLEAKVAGADVYRRKVM
jgi:4-amino-4-deoxy-L-arabinose transferase-like glycosyltransferase